MSILYSRLCNSLQRIECLSFAEVLFTFSDYKLHWRTFYSYIETRQDVIKRSVKKKEVCLLHMQCNIANFFIGTQRFSAYVASSTRTPFLMGKKFFSVAFVNK